MCCRADERRCHSARLLLRGGGVSVWLGYPLLSSIDTVHVLTSGRPPVRCRVPLALCRAVGARGAVEVLAVLCVYLCALLPNTVRVQELVNNRMEFRYIKE